ncbi:MAG: hypothetical protein ACYS0H_17160 [Planctomycetota bacterium]
MSKKVILLTGAAGLVSFAGAFVFAWLSNPTEAGGPDGTSQPETVADNPLAVSSGPQTMTPSAAGAPPGSMKKALTEQQLKSLVQDVRQKMREYEDRLQAIGMRERRLQVAQNVLKEDIENLDNLRVEVASAITSLKSERDQLLKSRLEIDQKEKANMVVLAASYDKMDVTGAGKILASMCKSEYPAKLDSVDVDGKNSSYDDAVKILHYMTERTKAKLLAELASTEPALAASLCQRLKQIVESR